MVPVLRHRDLRVWALGASAALTVVAVFYPRILDAPNRAWLALGERLSIVTSTMLLGIIYFVVLTPIAVFARLRGKDALKTTFAPERSTYWMARDKPDPSTKSLTRQF
jgi:hypothetical protein